MSPSTIERCTKHVGETAGLPNRERDLIHELSRRLDFLWRCDQYRANAEGDDEITGFWEDVKRQEEKNVERLRELVCMEARDGRI